MSCCYKDNLRKAIGTFTSNYSFYAFYLRVGLLWVGDR